MLEKITETLVVSEFHELNNKKDKLVKLFFLDYIKSLPYYYIYLIVIYMHVFNILSFIFYFKPFSSLEINKSTKEAKIIHNKKTKADSLYNLSLSTFIINKS